LKPAIVIDTWKLAIFDKHLSKDGFTYTNTGAGLTEDTLVLTLETDRMQALAQTVLRAQQECAKVKRK
jgi:hypothetical protein